MNNVTCLLTRLLACPLVYVATGTNLRIPLAVACAVIGASFFVLWSGLVVRDSGMESDSIWWQDLRIVHAITYSVASCLIFLDRRLEGAAVLLLDASLGAAFFDMHRTGVL